ncbi:uncharacterized protein BDZ99DRAFT_488722 [Mytilinidion resinicola]|uniref:Uncharacterized protein n=1 Tax=Mytilinidion resinicola TaxID=574789 RepID=A0A6A6YK13_9PEZI|nr:uncharacterized protein BDZ99DRAFT_488722 [Mytilinidion resinicola]KAF2808873.1 hypothetical protein BDZ99DRAFT_488722 [Mytilinidion resinicola]
MATSENVTLSDLHSPKEASITAFTTVLPALKHKLIYIRHQHDKHEPEYFRAVSSLSDNDLTSFTISDLEAVRVGSSAYGLHLFGKVGLPAAPGSYIHVRVFVAAEEGTDGASEEDRVAKLHCIHTEEVVKEDGDHVYRAIFKKDDPLEWFDT